MVVTSVDNSSGTRTVSWQWSSAACGSSSFTATNGSTTNFAVPGNYVPPSGEADRGLESGVTTEIELARIGRDE